MFFAGTDGVEAVDVPEVAGGGAGDCGVGFCAGRPSGAGEDSVPMNRFRFLPIYCHTSFHSIPDNLRSSPDPAINTL